MRHAGRATPLPDAVLSRSAIDEIAGAYLEETRGNADAALRRAIHDALAQALHAERLVSHGFVRGEFALRGNRPKSKGGAVRHKRHFSENDANALATHRHSASRHRLRPPSESC